MNKSRMAVLGAVAAFALLLVGGAGPAAAQTQGTPLTKVVKMTAAAKNGKKFKGTYTIKRFTQSGGKVYAVGALKGKLKGRNVKRSGRPHPGHARPPRRGRRLAAAAEPDARAPARCSTSC